MPEDVANQYTDDHSRKQYYTRWAFAVHYFWDEGLMQIPVAEAPPPGGGTRIACEIVREKAPCGSLALVWVAERNGEAPDVPHPESNNQNLVLSKYSITPEAPILDPAGNVRLYKVSGRYEYFLKQPVYNATDGAWFGWCAFDKIAPNINILLPGKFKRVF